MRLKFKFGIRTLLILTAVGAVACLYLATISKRWELNAIRRAGWKVVVEGESVELRALSGQSIPPAPPFLQVNIRSMVINRQKVDRAVMERIVTYSDLAELSFRNCQFQPNDLSALSGLAELRMIEFDQMLVDERHFNALASLPALSEVRVRSTFAHPLRWSEHDVSALARIPNLRSLTLDGLRSEWNEDISFDDRLFQQVLDEATKLEHVTLIRTSIGDPSVPAIIAAPNLRSMEWVNNRLTCSGHERILLGKPTLDVVVHGTLHPDVSTETSDARDHELFEMQLPEVLLDSD